jgi:hypothetical protein
MDVAGPQMTFPTAFCCNCGALDCVTEVQDTRVTRYFGLGGTETTFHLPLPVCARCRRSIRRPPRGFFMSLLVLALCIAAAFLLLWLPGLSLSYPDWLRTQLFAVSLVPAIAVFALLWRLRLPKAPQTSFYQPVRIKVANVAVSDMASGAGRVVFMKLAFTNPHYLDLFRNANREAIEAGAIAAVRI